MISYRLQYKRESVRKMLFREAGVRWCRNKFILPKKLRRSKKGLNKPCRKRRGKKGLIVNRANQQLPSPIDSKMPARATLLRECRRRRVPFPIQSI